MNETLFMIIAQIFGAFSFVFITISNTKKEKEKILFYSVFSNFSSMLQYLCLFDLTGASTRFVAVVRNVVFRVYDKKEWKPQPLLLILFLAFSVGSIIFTWHSVFAIFMLINVIVRTFSQWQPKANITRLGILVANIANGIYDFSVGAWVIVVRAIVQIITGGISIYRYDIKSEARNI